MLVPGVVVQMLLRHGVSGTSTRSVVRRTNTSAYRGSARALSVRRRVLVASKPGAKYLRKNDPCGFIGVGKVG